MSAPRRRASAQFLAMIAAITAGIPAEAEPRQAPARRTPEPLPCHPQCKPVPSEPTPAELRAQAKRERRALRNLHLVGRLMSKERS